MEIHHQQLMEHYFKTWGMSKKYGPLNFNNLKMDNSTMGKSIISAVKKLEKFTIGILNKNQDQIKKLANRLLEKETIENQDINDVLDNSIENSIEIKI